MNDRYLWDKSGEPDPEVERLEKLLGRYAYRTPRPKVVEMPRWRRPLAIAASLSIVSAAVWMATRDASIAWTVSRVDGAPRIGQRSVDERANLATGQILETDSASRAWIKVGAIGEVGVGPNSRLRLLRTRQDEQRMALDRGIIQATIYAPAQTFFVDTPSAVAVDLGCKYVLEVDDAGAGRLRVVMGWVGFEWQGQESFIPEGAYCLTSPDGKLGTPYYEDVSERFRAALRRFDFEGGGPDALGVVLGEARRRDALSLWHLVVRVAPEQRGAVYDRLAALVPPPAGVTREGILRLDRKMHDLWWDALGLENTSWWRKWKRPWMVK